MRYLDIKVLMLDPYPLPINNIEVVTISEAAQVRSSI